MSSRAKHAMRSHRGYRNKQYAFSGFYYHAPKSFRHAEYSRDGLIAKLFGWLRFAR